ETDFQQINVVPAGTSARVSQDGFSFSRTSLLDDFENQDSISEADYSDLLEKAVSEVTNNTKAALKHPSFDHIIVDLSGGMDSRAVFCAVTRLPEFHHKVKIHTRYTPTEPA